MILPDEFDAFYKDARTRLLLQTYALTGDLPAARSAVRDSFVVTWHHWRKVHRLPDPEGWVRPHAWSRAQRRNTARIWHRDKHLDPEAAATLDALGKLSLAQRKAFLLDQLTDLPPGERARELGVPEPEAEQLLRAAHDRFLAQRDVAADELPRVFDPLRERVAEATWPRAPIVRRAGAARRRTHTLVGSVVVVAAVVVSGILVTGVPADESGDDSAASGPAAEDGAAPSSFDADRLLSADALSIVVDGRGWRERRTSDNTAGDGLVTPCQQQRFADPEGRAALVRTYGTSPRRREPKVSAVQTAELSANPRAAHRAWRRALRWYGGCVTPQVQLVATYAVKGVADEAMLFHLRRWRSPASTYLVGVARTGDITTATVTDTRSTRPPDLRGAARLLGRAVNGLCQVSEKGACARPEPRLVAAPPVKVGDAPGLIVEADLPPVEGVGKPWVGTQPERARENVAATRCDRADFSGKPVRRAVTRTFLVPGARLPAAFGLTETAGRLPGQQARQFVRTIRDRMASCEGRDLGSRVTLLTSTGGPDRDLVIWRVTSEVADNSTVTFLMAIVRNGTAVGQLGFVPDGITMPPGAFESLARRAGARLAHLPPPKG
jgi:DNA-directed RNA polymerase specialized sigma24 family protein